MKFSFKRFLGSALAAVMTVSVLSVGMVTSVSAADLADEKNVNTKVEDGWDFSKITTGTNNANAGDTLNGIYIFNPGSRTYFKNKTDGFNVHTDAKSPVAIFGIPVSSPEGDITILNSSNYGDNDRAIALKSGDFKGLSKDNGGCKYTYSVNDLTKVGNQYYVEFAMKGSEAKIQSIKLVERSGEITFDSGKIDYDQPAEGCTVTVINVDDSNSVVTSGSTVDGGKTVSFSIDVDDGYAATIKVNGTEKNLRPDNSYRFTVNGNLNISIELIKLATRTPITSSFIYDGTDNDDADEAYIVQSGQIVRDGYVYYISLADGASLSNNKRINVSKSTDGATNSIIFSTGDLTGKTAKMTVSYASSSDSSSRTLQLGTIENGVGTVNKDIGSATAYTYSSAEQLDSNTEYFISSSNNTMYVNKIVITVTDNDTSAVPVATAVTTDNNYVFAGITEDAAKDFDSLEIYASSAATAADAIVGTNNLVGKTTTVYDSVEDVTTPEGLTGKKVYAVEVTNKEAAKDFHFAAIVRSATNGDKISAVATAEIPQATAAAN